MFETKGITRKERLKDYRSVDVKISDLVVLDVDLECVGEAEIEVAYTLKIKDNELVFTELEAWDIDGNPLPTFSYSDTYILEERIIKSELKYNDLLSYTEYNDYLVPTKILKWHIY